MAKKKKRTPTRKPKAKTVARNPKASSTGLTLSPEARWLDAVKKMREDINMFPVECYHVLSNQNQAYFVQRVQALIEQLTEICEELHSKGH